MDAGFLLVTVIIVACGAALGYSVVRIIRILEEEL